MRWRIPRPRRRAAGAPAATDSAVLMYHRIAESAVDPWELCVSPAHFAEHLQVLRGWDVIARLEDIVADDGPARRRVALTLDDGYPDTVSDALPLLDAYDVPMTVYVMTAGLGAPTSTWWDQLADAVLQADDGWSAYGEPTTGEQARYLELWQCAVDLPADRQATFVGGLSTTTATSVRLLLADELAVLGRHPLLTIGGHTVHHPALPALDEETRRREIEDGRRHLEEVVGSAVRDFAYPYGRYDEATVSTVRRLGWHSAVTTDAGLLGARSDRLRLPRLQVPDIDGDAFAQWLTARWTR